MACPSVRCTNFTERCLPRGTEARWARGPWMRRPGSPAFSRVGAHTRLCQLRNPPSRATPNVGRELKRASRLFPPERTAHGRAFCSTPGLGISICVAKVTNSQNVDALERRLEPLRVPVDVSLVPLRHHNVQIGRGCRDHGIKYVLKLRLAL